MTQEEFDLQVERITSTFPKIDDGSLKELQRAYLKIDPDLFYRMVSWVVENSNFTPKPAKFKEAHRACMAVWRRAKSQKPLGCDDCRGGFVRVYYMWGTPENNAPYDACQPCESCNKQQVQGQTLIDGTENTKRIIRYLSKEEFAEMSNQDVDSLPV